MDTNDDELDKLIQETQDIWKSLKNSGVEIKDSESENINKDDMNIDDLDKIATKLDNSTLNIINDNTNLTNLTNLTNNTSISNLNDRSRTLEGLNLATPPNELSTLLMSEEPSKLSQIRFSTPTFKQSNYTNNNNSRNRNNNNNNNHSTNISLPDTPFLFSPSLPVHNVGNDDTNITLSNNKHEFNAINTIDFSENCWHEINEMLSRLGFSVLVKQHNDKFEEESTNIIICNRFKEILNKYEQELNDLKLKNKHLKKELHISSEKMIDLKQEIKEIKEKSIEIDNKNDDLLINIKHQLQHCKNIINKKNEEISKLKDKLQKTIEKDALKRESVEAVFQSINKRNSKKNNKKDQKQLDIMQMYQEERKKMQNEIKFLRKELRNINQKLLEKNKYDHVCNDDKKKKKKEKTKESKSSWNISYTPSSKQQSDESDDDDVVIDLKWKTKNEITKKIENINDIERAKDLNRLESQKLREKLDKIYREKEELENDLVQSKQEQKSLSNELEKRPSYTEWTRLRQELNSMNKQLLETKKIATLRKYMDTRELIKRDKEIYCLKLTEIDGLPTQIMKEILQDLCRILSIKDVTILVETVHKITKCVECVPILEQYISKIVRILIASDHAPQLVKISKISPKNIFDQVIPILKQWVIQLDKVNALTTFRAKINTLLKKRTIYKNDKNDKNNKNNENNMLTLHEIVKQIDELVQSEEYLLNSKQCFNNAQKQLMSNPNDLCNRIIRHFQHIFTIKTIEGVFPRMNQIYLELNEMRNLLKTIKSILGLPANCAVNLCFKQLQKIIDENNINEKENEKEKEKENQYEKENNPIVIEIQTLLQCKNEDEILIQCKELIDRCKEYDAVFPRVHNLVNQLRTTLNVEYAHQILPKVKELVAIQ